jgi:ATP-binding cassette subfamily B protein
MRRLLALVQPHARDACGVAGCIALCAALSVVPALLTTRLVDLGLARRDLREIALDAGIMIAAAIVPALLGIVQTYTSARLGQAITRDLRAQLVTHLHRLPVSFFTDTRAGEVLNRVTSDVDTVDGALIGVATGALTNLLGAAAAVLAMAALDWRLMLVALALMPPMLLPLNATGHRLYGVRRAAREKHDELTALLQDTLSLSGITLVKSFARRDFEASRVRALGADLMALEIRAAMVTRWFLAVLSAMMIVAPALVWLTGGYLVVRAGVSAGVVVAFVALLARLYSPASALLGTRLQLVAAFAVFDRLFEYLDLAPEALPRAAAAPPFVPAQGRVEFEGVRFAYGDGRTALDGVTFRADGGQTVAIVGPSGSGKTTIANLLLRFYDRDTGTIAIDGRDVRRIDVDELRSHIGIVTQETYLFHDTVANNIRYGRLGASQAEIEAAARAANIDHVVRALPLGYDTVVGDRGHKLSGGERQRVAIARILLKNPRILILDEATSALDTQAEAIVQEALARAMRGRTSLVIAHRLSTVESADLILVMRDGKIVERGSHADLLAARGLYGSLAARTFAS